MNGRLNVGLMFLQICMYMYVASGGGPLPSDGLKINEVGCSKARNYSTTGQQSPRANTSFHILTVTV